MDARDGSRNLVVKNGLLSKSIDPLTLNNKINQAHLSVLDVVRRSYLSKKLNQLSVEDKKLRRFDS